MSSLMLCGIPVIRNSTPTTKVKMGMVRTWMCVTCTSFDSLIGLITSVCSRIPEP